MWSVVEIAGHCGMTYCKKCKSRVVYGYNPKKGDKIEKEPPAKVGFFGRLFGRSKNRDTQPEVGTERAVKGEKIIGDIKNNLSIESLIAALEDESYSVRSKAALALGEIGDKRAVEPLIAILLDKNEFVRMDTVLALGKIGDKLAVVPLIAALNDGHGYVRRDASIGTG